MALLTQNGLELTKLSLLEAGTKKYICLSNYVVLRFANPLVVFFSKLKQRVSFNGLTYVLHKFLIKVKVVNGV